MQKQKTRELISVQQAADLLGYTRQHTGLLIRQGKIKAQRVGRGWVIEKAEILRLL